MAREKSTPQFSAPLMAGRLRSLISTGWRTQFRDPLRSQPLLRYFWILGLASGIIMIFINPPLMGFDATSHYRAVEYYVEGARHALPDTPGTVKQVQIDAQAAEAIDIAGAIQQKHLIQPSMYGIFLRHDKQGLSTADLGGAAVYSPVAYAPPIAGAVLGKVLHTPLLVQIWLARFACLLAYLLLVYFALRCIPFGKWALFVIALLPMSMFQAATVTTDGFLNGMVFLFVAIVLRLMYQKERQPRRQTVLLSTLAALSVSIALSKPSYSVMVLLVLLIPAARFTQTWRKWIYAGGVLGASALAGLGWNLHIKEYVTRVGEVYQGNDISSSAQLSSIMAHPIHFMAALCNTVYQSGYDFLGQLIGTFDPAFHLLPVFVALPLIVLLVLGILQDSEKILKLAWRSRLFMGALLVVLLGAIALTFYLTYTPVMAGNIQGMQGRYFIPLLVLLIPLLATRYVRVQLRRPERLFVPFVVLALLVACIQIPLVDYWLT